RPHSSRRQPGRPAGAGGGQVRNDSESQNGENSGNHRTAWPAGGRRRGDRVIKACSTRITLLIYGDDAMAKYWASFFPALVIGALTGRIWAQEIGNKVLPTPNAPMAAGPYSQAIRVGQTVYLAGQIAIDPNTKQPMSSATIEEQTRRVLDNISAV